MFGANSFLEILLRKIAKVYNMAEGECVNEKAVYSNSSREIR